MAMLKRGTSSTSLIVSSFVYVCDYCGHTQIIKDESLENIKCSKCDQGKMQLISSHAESKEPRILNPALR